MLQDRLSFIHLFFFFLKALQKKRGLLKRKKIASTQYQRALFAFDYSSISDRSAASSNYSKGGAQTQRNGLLAAGG